MTRTRLSEPSAWQGVWTALITPLNDRLELDESGLKSLIEAQIQGGITGLVIAGSTGEGSLLSRAVYEKLLASAREIAGSRIPLVAGIGIGGTAACLENIALAKRHNYDGVLASPPAYVKAPQRALVEHYLTLGAAGLPVCLYEVPGRAGSSLHDATILELVRSSRDGARNLVALKDASADITRPLTLRRELGDSFALLTGDDGTYLGYLANGGDGIISVASHFALASLRRVRELLHKGEARAAAAEQARLLPMIDELFREANPIPVKSAAAALGLIQQAHFAPPLCAMKPELLSNLVNLVKAL